MDGSDATPPGEVTLSRPLFPVALVLLSCGAVWTQPAIAQPSETSQEEDDDYDPDVPRVRLELGLTAIGSVPTKVKKGPKGVRSFQPVDSQPTHLSLATAAYVDVKIFEWSSLGGFYFGWKRAGSARHLGEKGLAVDTQLFPPGARVRTRQEIQHAELSLRYVWKHTKTVHLWFGIGASWASYRITLDGAGRHASSRIEAHWAPAWTYSIAANLFDSPISFFLTSGISLSFSHFPSVITHSRTGLRFELLSGLQATVALSVHNARITDSKGVSGNSTTSGYRYERVRWSIIGLEVGLAYSF